jgi:hypothetical protein
VISPTPQGLDGNGARLEHIIPAAGQINQSGATITIEFVEPADHPSVVRITSPGAPSIITPSRFGAVAAEITRVVAGAAARYNQLKAQR